MIGNPPHAAAPPAPPPFPRRIWITPGQAASLLLLATLPVLAMLGTFGSDNERVLIARGDGVTLTVAHMERLRYGYPARLKIRADASDPQRLRGALIRVDAALLERFDKVAAAPPPQRVSTNSYDFAVAENPDGYAIVIDLEPERYGHARGHVTLDLSSGTALELPLQAFIFP